MMDGMADGDVQVSDGWIIAKTDEVHRSDMSLAGQSLKKRHALSNVLLMPLGNFIASLQCRRSGSGFSKLPLHNRVQKPNLNRCQMPAELNRRHALGIRSELAAIRWNRAQDSLGHSLLGLKLRQQKIQKKLGLFWLHCESTISLSL